MLRLRKAPSLRCTNAGGWAALAALALTSIAAPAEPALDLGRMRGQVVVVDFWASWCVPCRRSFPWLNAMRAKYADRGLVIIGVNVDKSREDAERFLASTPATFEIVYDPEGALPARFGVNGMPSSFVFDRSGKLVVTHLGFRNGRRAEYERVLRETLDRGDSAADREPVKSR